MNFWYKSKTEIEKLDLCSRNDGNSSPSELRADFMRRWFAVAISVGFASTVVSLEWLPDGRPQNSDDWNQIWRLTAALLATVLSWEGYFQSIATKKLFDFWRFFLDFALVLVYLLLLITSMYDDFWLKLHFFTFILYIIWDTSTIYLYPDRYNSDLRAVNYPFINRILYIFSTYFGGLVGSKNWNRGPIITFFWALYFLFVFTTMNEKSVFIGFVFVVLGVVLYRWDKGSMREKTLFSPVVVSILISIMIVLNCHL